MIKNIGNKVIHLFIYSIGVLRLFQEYLSYTTTGSIMEGGNWTIHRVVGRFPQDLLTNGRYEEDSTGWTHRDPDGSHGRRLTHCLFGRDS